MCTCNTSVVTITYKYVFAGLKECEATCPKAIGMCEYVDQHAVSINGVYVGVYVNGYKCKVEGIAAVALRLKCSSFAIFACALFTFVR